MNPDENQSDRAEVHPTIRTRVTLQDLLLSASIQLSSATFILQVFRDEEEWQCELQAPQAFFHGWRGRSLHQIRMAIPAYETSIYQLQLSIEGGPPTPGQNRTPTPSLPTGDRWSPDPASQSPINAPMQSNLLDSWQQQRRQDWQFSPMSDTSSQGGEEHMYSEDVVCGPCLTQSKTASILLSDRDPTLTTLVATPPMTLQEKEATLMEPPVGRYTNQGFTTILRSFTALHPSLEAEIAECPCLAKSTSANAPRCGTDGCYKAEIGLQCNTTCGDQCLNRQFSKGLWQGKPLVDVDTSCEVHTQSEASSVLNRLNQTGG